MGQNDEDVELFLETKFANVDEYPQHTLVFAENVPVLQHKEIQLTNLDPTLVSVKEIDEIPLSEFRIEAISKRKISETGNLATQLNLKLVYRLC